MAIPSSSSSSSVYHTPGGMVQRAIDVTIRCPHAETYSNSHQCAGAAAAAGEKCKLDRYDDSVLAIAFETFGRLGRVSIANLHMIAQDMFLQDKRRHSEAWHYHYLRYSLERALVFHAADNCLLSLGTNSGLYNWRARRGTG